MEPKPPTTRTLPVGNSVAVWVWRAVWRSPVPVHVPVAGSYTSALLRVPVLLMPPTTKTLPFASSVAV